MKTMIIGIALLLVAGALFFGGIFLGEAAANDIQNSWMIGGFQRGIDSSGEGDDYAGCTYGRGAGMMTDDMMGAGFNTDFCDDDFMGNGIGMMGGHGMMGSYGMMNGGYGMMGGYGYDGLTEVIPLSIEDAETALAEYLVSLGNDNLAVGEIMIFDNHAYAQIVDRSSDTGAFEVLVDPVTMNVYAEPGPNMMWNTEYGHMSGSGGYGMMGSMMGGGMMGNFVPNTEISVTGQEAIAIAQEYLDNYLDGASVGETADAFPGYYTIHTLRDGETIGMLSVNAYTGQVFLHHWHGEFLEMTGEEHG